jgi:hypothetical protein
MVLAREETPSEGQAVMVLAKEEAERKDHQKLADLAEKVVGSGDVKPTVPLVEVRINTPKKAGPITAEEAVYCFQALDVKRKGYLNPMNFGLGIRAVTKISLKAEMELFHRYNESGSGVMTMEEFTAAATTEMDEMLVAGLKRWARLGSKTSTPDVKASNLNSFATPPETPDRRRAAKAGAKASPMHDRLAARRADSGGKKVADSSRRRQCM